MLRCSAGLGGLSGLFPYLFVTFHLFERIGSYLIVGLDHQPADKNSELGVAASNLARVVLERYIAEDWIELDCCEKRFALVDTRYFAFGCTGSMID
jgi:hypothetical protein